MPRGYKFSAFSGVYTPSLLTILGVIMYMRLGWVVGQAGLVIALIIILISHVISFTTALSISSIATDKKIKAGGIYYILSRSLGLSMGGSIGIALTLGTALGISMYIVGFAENFLSIKPISDFLGLPPTANSIRIVGSVILAILTILAMISTSLAIKTQYFILAAIALSLISIFAGFGIKVEFHPDSPLWAAAEGHLPFETIFAIFFPAVTGFTAGVAMSGDLRDPRKDIPRGTMAAIATGLIVYIALAMGFGLFVKREFLLADNNVAMHVAWIPALVVAGIWGATLSSALGGILGAPRILQALSADGVTPAALGKTYGKKNEPRTALVIIYLIAQGGILIGNLNAIASIVTMFYLTSYGFINLAYVLESWADTDFRPSFRVPIIVGIVGFVFAFTVMLKIDMISMIAALVIIGGIYFYLQRRQLKLEGGDVWRSVWISLIRRGLSTLISMPENDQNWQPNIILFTGGTDRRSHLLEFARSLVGHYGLLTNFDLVVNNEAEVLFPKYQQNYVDRSLQRTGIFFRRMTVKDVYQGIEMIARTYGFSGLEPNTIILGWPRNSKNPEQFVHLLQVIHSLDYNLILIDYDSRYGFGRYQQIDIWWRGAGNNGNFALMLAKLMTISEPWRGALIRLLIVNDDDSKAFYLYRRASDMLSNLRIDAQVKIINNEMEKRPFYDIVRKESNTADLVFIGLPEIPRGAEHDFINRTNRLLFEIGTVALIRASRVFKDLNLGININQKPVLAQNRKYQIKPVIARQKLSLTPHESVNQVFTQLQDKLNNIFETTIQTFVFTQADDFTLLLDQLSDIIPVVNKLILMPKDFTPIQNQRYILRYQNYLIMIIQRQIKMFKHRYLDEINESMENIILEIKPKFQTLLEIMPNHLTLEYPADNLPSNISSLRIKLTRALHQITHSTEKGIKINYNTRHLQRLLHTRFLELLFLDIELIRIETLRFAYNFEKFFSLYLEALESLKETETDRVRDRLTETDKNLNVLMGLLQDMPKRVAEQRKELIIRILNEILENFSSPERLVNLDKNYSKKYRRTISQKIENEVSIFFDSMSLYLNQILAENYMYGFYINAKQCLRELQDSLTQTDGINPLLDKITRMHQSLNQITLSAPRQILIMDSDSLNDSFYKNFTHLKTIELPLRQQLTTITKNQIIEPLITTLNTFPTLNTRARDTLKKLITDIEQQLEQIIGQKQ